MAKANPHITSVPEQKAGITGPVLVMADIVPAEEGWWTHSRVTLLAALIFLAALCLRAPRLTFPMLWFDDFAFLRDSWTWSVAWKNLWVPFNEHISPLSRITTWGLVRVSGCAKALPYVLALQGPLALFLCMALLYLFLRREVGHPVYGLIGMALFGVSSQFEEAITWFSASFNLISLAFLLLGLLAAQRWRQQRRVRSLVACVVWMALAPSCFAIGVLAGPLCALYLLLPAQTEAREKEAQPLWATFLVALTPLLGTGLFLAVSLPGAASTIMHSAHYGGKTALQMFHPERVPWLSARSLVDNGLIGTFGWSGSVRPESEVPYLLAGILAAAAWWWWIAPHRSLLLLGLGFIFSSHLLILGIRAEWGYEAIAAWGRYQVFPHIGLVLFVCGGLPRWKGWFVAGKGRWAPGHNRIWLAVLFGLLLTQIPRSVIAARGQFYREQSDQLRRVDEVDAGCRQFRISAASARAALPPFGMVAGQDYDNAWDFLRGSDDPLPRDREEIVRLLQP